MSSTLFFQHFMVLTFIGILNPLWQFYKSNLNWIQNTWFITSRCYIAVVVPHITFYIALSMNLSSTPSLIIILLLFLKKKTHLENWFNSLHVIYLKDWYLHLLFMGCLDAGGSEDNVGDSVHTRQTISLHFRHPFNMSEIA